MPGARNEVEKQVSGQGGAVVATDGGSKGDAIDSKVASFGIAVGSKRAGGHMGGVLTKRHAWRRSGPCLN